MVVQSERNYLPNSGGLGTTLAPTLWDSIADTIAVLTQARSRVP